MVSDPTFPGLRYPARVNVDVIHCELCNNPYRRAAGSASAGEGIRHARGSHAARKLTTHVLDLLRELLAVTLYRCRYECRLPIFAIPVS